MAEITIQEAVELAIRHRNEGRLQESEAITRQILGVDPQNAVAFHLLGTIATQVGKLDDAVQLICQSLAIHPNSEFAYNNLGVAYKKRGELDQAIAAYRQSVTINPLYALAYSNLADALNLQGQIEEAITASREAIALDPQLAQAYSNLGNALMSKGDSAAAVEVFRKATALSPRVADFHSNLGSALIATKQFDEAIRACRQAVAIDRNHSTGFSNLGLALESKRDLDGALEAYSRALSSHAVNEAGILNNLGNVFKEKGWIDEAIPLYRRAISIKPDLSVAHSNLLLTLHYSSNWNTTAIADEHRRWSQVHAEPLARSVRPHANIRDPDRRLRIGYVSPDLCLHAVGRFLLPLLEAHDRSRFELIAFADEIKSDAASERMRNGVDAWRNLTGRSDEQAAELIRSDQIDILVDLALHTSNNRLLAFARKPAPVQATYLAYAGTSGMRVMDYRLSDPYLDPVGMDESIYSETTVRLPETYWCYQAIIPPELRPPATGSRPITFGCLNNLCKVNENTLKLWALILKQVGGSRLLMHALEGNHRGKTQAFLQRHGVDPSRVSFVARLDLLDYFMCYHSIDIALDTFPFGGGTTTCDALWMGTPVVSLVGQTAVGRGGLSILSNIGLAEFAAKSQDDYADIAVKLANDRQRLNELHTTLRSRMERSPLMDASRFARNIESAYRQMWRTWCEANQ